MRRSIKIAGALTLITGLVAAAAPELLKIPLTLAIGWIKSTGRFASVVQLSAPTVAWSLIAVSILLTGTHAFCAWVRRARSSAAGPWKWKWTCGFYAALVLVLFASASLVGIGHQSGWMIGSKEPVFKRRGVAWKERIRLRNIGNDILEQARASEWDFARLKSDLTTQVATWEDFAFYFVSERNDAPPRIILLPRNPKSQTEIGVVERDTFSTRPFRDFTELLVRNPP